MGGSKKDLKGIVGIDPETIVGDAQTLRQGMLSGIAGGDEPTLADVWAHDELRSSTDEVVDGLGSEATALTALEDAFPGLEIVDEF